MSLSKVPPSILQPPSEAEVTPAISSLRSHVKDKAGSEDGSRPLVSFTDESGKSTPISYNDIYQCMEQSPDAQEVIKEASNDKNVWDAFCGLPTVLNILKSMTEDGFDRAKTTLSKLASNSEKPKLRWEYIFSTLSGWGEAIWKFMKQMFERIHSGIKGTIKVMKDSGHQLKSLFVSFFTSIVAMFGVLVDRLAQQATMI
ncbi:uncharacterized protein LOC114277792 [Camellia sinensis]|uniref:uncharacterized protein LOC114277792 n=1 Tax=Camellia sinensis TaxID=4442 RepID=UPI0010364A83|nr:uncharacterized protein LOC114277792 [Camellia sinensis]